MAAPFPVLMIPREGPVHLFKVTGNSAGNKMVTATETFETVFVSNETDAVIVLQNNTILFEKYWNGLSRHYQHIWFSVSKSLVSTALGILVSQNKID